MHLRKIGKSGTPTTTPEAIRGLLRHSADHPPRDNANWYVPETRESLYGLLYPLTQSAKHRT
jgi:hypothetical protein